MSVRLRYRLAKNQSRNGRKGINEGIFFMYFQVPTVVAIQTTFMYLMYCLEYRHIYTKNMMIRHIVSTNY